MIKNWLCGLRLRCGLGLDNQIPPDLHSRKLAIALEVKVLVVLMPKTDWLPTLTNDGGELGHLYWVRNNLETIFVEKLEVQATFSISGINEMLGVPSNLNGNEKSSGNKLRPCNYTDTKGLLQVKLPGLYFLEWSGSLTFPRFLDL